MSNNRARLHWIVGLTFLLLLVGCVQDAGGPDVPNIQSELLPSPTFTPTATTPPTDTPPPPATIEVQSAVTTDTPTALFVQPTLEPTATADDAFAARATELVLQITQTVYVAETATAQALGFGITLTPTPTEFVPGATEVRLPGQDCVHEIRVGENLFRLSQRYGLSVTEIATYNGIALINDPTVGVRANLTIGQRVVIPGCGTTGNIPPATSAPVVTPVPSTGTTNIAGTQPAVQVPAGPTPLPVDSGRTHIVREGETLFTIAQQYGVTVDALASLNNLTDANTIIMGQTIKIPQP